MRHIISNTILVRTFETANPLSRESTERYSYVIQYLDGASMPRESEEATGFFSHEDALRDAMRNLDKLDMTPEVEKVGERIITAAYHVHNCKQACGVHRCINPACEVAGKFTPKRVAEIICPRCGEQTGTSDYFERQKLSIAEFIELDVEQAIAA